MIKIKKNCVMDMKAFSKSWKSSKKPRKQRKYTYNAPLHLKRKLVKTKVSEDLEEKYKVKNLIVRKNDIVKVLRGEFKGKQGKVIGFSNKDYRRVLIEGIEVEKKAGEKKLIPIHHSNLLIVSVEEDPKRFKKVKVENKKSDKKVEKKVKKEVKKTDNNIVKESDNKIEVKEVKKESETEDNKIEFKENKKEDNKEIIN